MRKIFALTGILFLLIGCRTENKYTISSYHDQDTIDTLLVNLVTFVGVKPKAANWETRLLPEHRSYYINQAKQFSFDRYFVSPEGLHYFFMVRPARHPKGNQRGVGGKFRLTEDMQITELEELFNTPVMPNEEIILKGRKIFNEMITNGNIEKYLNDKDYIEWPDERLKYDKVKNEWRYDLK
jgi:hypothetical protein